MLFFDSVFLLAAIVFKDKILISAKYATTADTLMVLSKGLVSVHIFENILWVYCSLYLKKTNLLIVAIFFNR